MDLKKYCIITAVATILLALSFQGTRGIWEPDEGFYFSASRTMVETGDWLVPRMYVRPFLDKPPMVYWSIALGMKVFGINEWGARMVQALWYILTVLVVGLLGRSFWDSKTGVLAAFIYAASILPVLSGNIVTPDVSFTFWITASMFVFWRSISRRKGQWPFPWNILLGICLGLAALSKGPAALVFIAPMVLFLLFTHRFMRFLLQWDTFVGLFLLIVIGASWYVMVFRIVPGALAYLWDNQVIGRLFTAKYNRNPEYYAPFFIYFPLLIFATLPWSVAWYPVWLRRWRAADRWKSAFRCPDNPRILFLLLWILIPLAVFSFARSRLPLYILPLFAPLAVATARCWIGWIPSLLESPLPAQASLAGVFWVLLLLGIKAGLAYWPSDSDTRAFWENIQDQLPHGRYELVTVNTRKHGLSFYSGGNVEWVTTRTDPYPFFVKQLSLEEEAKELKASPEYHVFIVPKRHYDSAKPILLSYAPDIRETTGPYGMALFIATPSDPDHTVVRLAAMGDTRSGDSMQAQLGAALYQVDQTTPLDGIILLGDNISYSGDPQFFNDAFERPYLSLLRNGVRFFAVLGNHDVNGGFSDFQLSVPDLNMDGRHYYSKVFKEGLVECFFLDSNTFTTDPGQQNWLKRQLHESTAEWKIVASHVPIYGSIERRPSPDLDLRHVLEPILVEGGVRIYLAGHNHVYQRLQPRLGIQYFTAGSGGELDRGQILRNDPDLVTGEDQTNVALILEFTREECRFRAINPMEEIMDQGTISRSPEEPKTKS